MKKWNVFLLILSVLMLTACGSAESDSGDATASADSDDGSSDLSSELQANSDAAHKIILGHSGVGSEDNHIHFYSLKLKEYVEELSDGEVTIEVHPNNTLGGERDLIEGVQMGTVDISVTSNGPLGNFVNNTNALDMPFLFEDIDHVHRVLDGEIGQELSDEITENNIKLLTWGDNGFRYITNDVRPIKEVQDMENIDFRAVENPIYVSTYTALGTNPTSMAHGELYTSLQQGVVEAMDGPITWLVPGKYIEVQKHITDSKHFYSALPVLMNPQKFENMPEELQEILMESAKKAKESQADFIEEKTEEMIDIAIDNGNEFVPNDEFNTEDFKEATQPVYDEYEDNYGDMVERIKGS